MDIQNEQDLHRHGYTKKAENEAEKLSGARTAFSYTKKKPKKEGCRGGTPLVSGFMRTCRVKYMGVFFPIYIARILLWENDNHLFLKNEHMNIGAEQKKQRALF